VKNVNRKEAEVNPNDKSEQLKDEASELAEQIEELRAELAEDEAIKALEERLGLIELELDARDVDGNPVAVGDRVLRVRGTSVVELYGEVRLFQRGRKRPAPCGQHFWDHAKNACTCTLPDGHPGVHLDAAAAGLPLDHHWPTEPTENVLALVRIEGPGEPGIGSQFVCPVSHLSVRAAWSPLAAAAAEDAGWIDQDGAPVDPADVPKARAMAGERADALAALDADPEDAEPFSGGEGK
jgi:hypothetical protein